MMVYTEKKHISRGKLVLAWENMEGIKLYLSFFPSIDAWHRAYQLLGTYSIQDIGKAAVKRDQKFLWIM